MYRAVLLGFLAPLLLATAGAADGVDNSVRPGDDFFAYANGTWLAATEIPAGKELWNARSEIDALTRQQLASLIADSAAAPAGSDARKVADFRAAHADAATIETRGRAALQPLLDRIGRIHDKVALARLLGSELLADVDPLTWGLYNSSHLLGLSVQPGLHGEKTNVAFLLQGGLGLGDRARYSSAADDMQVMREKYRDYIGDLLALAGFDRAAQRAEGVLALETAIAQGHATPEASADERNVDNLWPRRDFARRAPGMHWDAFFAAAGLSQQDDLVVWQPGAVKSSAALVGSQPLAVWQDYLRFHVIDRYAAVLPRAFAERALAFHGKSSSAEEATQQALGAVLGRLYVARHFPPETKARAQAIVDNVIAAFRDRIASVTWLSASSKKIALAKLQAFHFDAGYPAKAADDPGLTVDPRDALGNLRRVAQWNYRKALARLGQPVDRTEWWIQPQTVGAVLLFQQNAYNFSAALLQPPKFAPAASDAANYGAFGAIVGHETSHVIDTLGAEYDASGRKTRWWTEQDYASFQAASAPLVQQFSDYRPLADAAVDGKLTQVENIADLAGLSVAFEAYRRTLGSKVHDKEYVRQQDREFFVGFARSWRGKMREDALRRYLVTDGHAPERFRVSTVRNIDAWYDAFDVRPGQRLYLEPRSRVRVW